jgi:hypothetical protein
MADDTTIERGPQIEADLLLDKHGKWHQAEKDAASKAGERRQEIGQTAENMAIENKALSQFRAGLKIKNEGKRQDWLRSWQELLPIAENVIFGNQPDMLSQAEQTDPEPSEPMSDDDVEQMADQMDADDANIEHVDFEKEPALG